MLSLTKSFGYYSQYVFMVLFGYSWFHLIIIFPNACVNPHLRFQVSSCEGGCHLCVLLSVAAHKGWRSDQSSASCQSPRLRPNSGLRRPTKHSQ